VVEFPDLGPGAQGTFRSSALTPLDKNGDPLPGWANRTAEHSSYSRPLKKVPKVANADTFGGATIPVLGRRAREARSNFGDFESYEQKSRKRSTSGTNRRRDPKSAVSENISVHVDWSGMRDLPPGNEFLKLAEVAFASAYMPAPAAEALDSQLCIANGLCSGCGTSLWQAKGDAGVAMFCWNTTCRASPLNDFKGPRSTAIPSFTTPSDGTGTRYSVEDANGVSFAVSTAAPPLTLAAPREPAPLAAALAKSSPSVALYNDKSLLMEFTSVASDTAVSVEFAVPEKPDAHLPQKPWEVHFPTPRSVSPLSVSSGSGSGSGSGRALRVDTTGTSTTSFLVSPFSTEHDKFQKSSLLFFSSGSSQDHDLDSEVRAVLQNSDENKGFQLQCVSADETDADPLVAAKRRGVQVLSPLQPEDEDKHDTVAFEFGGSPRARNVSLSL